MSVCPRDSRASNDRPRRSVIGRAMLAAGLLIVAVGGCAGTRQATQVSQATGGNSGMEHGLVLILPGILGKTPFEPNIGKGLADANVPLAVEEYDWTQGPLLLVGNYANLTGNERKQQQARQIAQRIMQYQNQYPGRPVHLIGHSGGGGMVLLALEVLPPGQKITSGILLGAPVSPDYDLRVAQSHTDAGIHNFYSKADVPMYAVTAVVGTMDGHHAGSAGSVGFNVPEKLTAMQRRQYERLLVQHEYSFDMVAKGHPGGHFGWTSRAFAKQWVAPIIADPQTAIADAATATATPVCYPAVTSQR